MQREEQQLIENLFSRLKQAESQSSPRDATAEQLISQQIQQQPAAPYYMAQAIIIQEAAMKQLNSRVSELEAQLASARQPSAQQSSGGFLSGLFGGGSARQQPAQASPSAWGNTPQQSNTYAPQPASAPSAGRGFLGGALQTAVGVAGGVMMADMLTSMFHHSQPEEIVNIINEPAVPQENTGNASGGIDNVSDGSFLNDDAGLPQDNDMNFGSDDVDNDSFGDDDSLI